MIYNFGMFNADRWSIGCRATAIMKRTIASIIILLTSTLVVQSIAGEPITDEQVKAVTKLATDLKQAMLAKDHERFVEMLFPPMVTAAGGRAKMVQLLKEEDRKNVQAGMIIESFKFAPSKTMHKSADFKLTFVASTLIASFHGTNRMESKSFHIAFARLDSERWYMIDGTRLTSEQFRGAFRGFPEDVQLPKVEKKFL